MRGQIGSWDECLAVTLEYDALAWLDACGCDRRVLIDVDKTTRVVTVMPDETGHRVCHRGMRNAVLHGVTLDWRLVNGPPLPRFELMPISLDATDGVALEIGLPPDHLLSWPRLRDCASYSAAEVACAELERRLMSAASFYGPEVLPKYWTWVQPPEEARQLISRAFWSEALRRAILSAASARPAASAPLARCA